MPVATTMLARAERRRMDFIMTIVAGNWSRMSVQEA
jgi:hypothetical protein